MCLMMEFKIEAIGQEILQGTDEDETSEVGEEKSPFALVGFLSCGVLIACRHRSNAGQKSKSPG